MPVIDRCKRPEFASNVDLEYSFYTKHFNLNRLTGSFPSGQGGRAARTIPDSGKAGYQVPRYTRCTPNTSMTCSSSAAAPPD
jgi:hypothetical protein